MAVYHAAYLRELRVLYVEDVCSGGAGDGRVEGKRKCLLTENVVDSRSGGKYVREGTDRVADGSSDGKRKSLVTENVIDSSFGGKYMREGTGNSEEVVSSSESDAESLLEVAGEARDTGICFVNNRR